MRYISALIFIIYSLAAIAQNPTSLDYFSRAPIDIASELDQYSRLDMADYFTHHANGKVQNRLGQKFHMTALSPEMLIYQDEDSTLTAIAAIPVAKSDTILLQIITITTPFTDSRIFFYNKNWHPLTAQPLQLPNLKDWLIYAKHSKEVEADLPFILSTASYNPESQTITLKNNTASFYYKNETPKFLQYLKPQLIYFWDGKRFRQN